MTDPTDTAPKGWLITGVSSGLGRALGQAALARGDAVAGTCRGAEDAAAFAALAPGRAFGFALDVADEAAVGRIVDQAEAALRQAGAGGIGVLVNNAGYGLVGAVEEASLAEARAQFEVNVFGPLALIKAVLPLMRGRRAGHVINVTSVSGLAAWAGTGIYCASKFALEGLGETLAQETAELGIQVTNVEPGGMRTDYAGRSLVHAAQTIADYDGLARQARHILADHAGHEPGDPARVAQAIVDVAGAPGAPLHLLLGADAQHYAMRKLEALAADFERWKALTLSVGFEGAQD